MRVLLVRGIGTFFFIHTLVGPTFGQSVEVSGLVRDRNTHKEIGHVNVYVKGGEIGTATDYGGRYVLRLLPSAESATIVFQHIAYKLLEIPVDSLLKLETVELQPRVIPMRGVTVEGRAVQRLEIEKDLTQEVSVIEGRTFEIRGYTDAGDLLRTDHSVQVQEELSGKKIVAIRGGNADEVIVLYNGIKMNSAYDNIFDLALIDLQDIERFEIIKGSHSALYGPEAFSGVINIVPKTQQDYHIRFQQRLGTYRSGNWGLHLYHKVKELSVAYSLKRGASRRTFIDSAGDDEGLRNSATHHTATLQYRFAANPAGGFSNSLNVMWFRSSLDYVNRRDDEILGNRNQMVTARYSRNSGRLAGLEVSLSRRWLDENQVLVTSAGGLNREIKDRALYVDLQKRFRLGRLGLLLGYQLRLSDLDLRDRRVDPLVQPVGLEAAGFERRHHGLVSILKFEDELDSSFLRTLHVDLSVRHDRLHDRQKDAVLRGTPPSGQPESVIGLFDAHQWQESMAKFSFRLSGNRQGLYLDGYLNFGTNVKFPTLFQQISAPALVGQVGSRATLSPEKNNSVEVGVVVTRETPEHPVVYGWRLSGNYFQNHYDNKFRVSVVPGIPVAFYDNVLDARISGFEARPALFFFRKKVTVEVGLSRYAISEKAAFPFKSDHKRTLTLSLDHAGYAFQLFWFKEGEQVGWLRQVRGGFAEVNLPDFTNLDVHLSKAFERNKLKLFVNASGRNLLGGSEVALEGLAIRDRRYYLTVGAQY